ncbi:isochorismatase hydrolase-2 [Coleophoma crateriformis]|uniref:Isochorismatase hydrolase-2 n=1 Tax=Coleophoma crateriformis TaxID=565419 RepID=A0A3D8SZG3_9HELO|nr:isochorismatase hydrolase-2 [Coleophoma crateriformis]
MTMIEIPHQQPSYKRPENINRLGWGARPALLLIDVCRAYWSEGSALDLLSNPEAAAAPDSMRRLVAAARAGKVPVIWAQVRYNAGVMLDAGMQYQKSTVCSIWQDGDTRGMDAWLPGLTADANDTIIYKKNPSAFFATTLSTELQLMHVDTLVLCGVSTSGCVRATALDAMCHGFRPMVVGSACGDRSKEIQNATLYDLDSNYADVVSEAEALEKVISGWS